MKSLPFIFTICILCCSVAKATEPARLIHRWEREPDVGVTWQITPALPIARIQSERLSSPLQSIPLNELHVAIRNAHNQQLQGAEQALAILLEQLGSLPENIPLRLSTATITVYAAWALQELAVAPQIVEDIFKFTQPTTQRLKDKAEVSELEVLRQSFLFEALGRNSYQPAVQELELYVPKGDQKMGELTRASAIWALGRILRGSKDEGLAKQLIERMNDESNLEMKFFFLVRSMSTLALGWIQAPSSLEALNRAPYQPPDPIGMYRLWSLEQFPTPSQN